MRTVEVITPQNVAINYKLASLGARILAYLIDSLLITAFYIVLFFLLFIPFVEMITDIGLIFLFLPIIFISTFYHLLMEQFNKGQSLGKAAMRIRVISENGSSPDFMQLFMRWLLRLVDMSLSSGAIAVLTIAITDKGQRVGDILGRTIVIDLRRSETITLAGQPADEMKPEHRQTQKTEPTSTSTNLMDNLRDNESEPAIEGITPEPTESESAKEKKDLETPLSSRPEPDSEIKYPEVITLSESDMRKLNALYSKVQSENYDIDVKRDMLGRMKNALEKKMGINSREDTTTAFLKQVFNDFHSMQKEKESRDGW